MDELAKYHVPWWLCYAVIMMFSNVLNQTNIEQNLIIFKNNILRRRCENETQQIVESSRKSCNEKEYNLCPFHKIVSDET